MTSSALVVVLAVAAGISLLRGLVPRLPLPGPLLELICGIVLGPTVLDVVKVDPLLSAVAGRSSLGVVEWEHSVGYTKSSAVRLDEVEPLSLVPAGAGVAVGRDAAGRIDHPRQMHEVPRHEGGVAVGEVVLGTA